MKYEFEKFTKLRGRSIGEPRVTITATGNMNLNQSFMKKFVKSPTHVIFHYDKTNKIIGLELTEDGSPPAYTIRTSRGGRQATVSAQAFLKYNKLKLKKTYSYPAELNEQYGLIIVDLKMSDS